MLYLFLLNISIQAATLCRRRFKFKLNVAAHCAQYYKNILYYKSQKSTLNCNIMQPLKPFCCSYCKHSGNIFADIIHHLVGTESQETFIIQNKISRWNYRKIHRKKVEPSPWLVYLFNLSFYLIYLSIDWK